MGALKKKLKKQNKKQASNKMLGAASRENNIKNGSPFYSPTKAIQAERHRFQAYSKMPPPRSKSLKRNSIQKPRTP